MTPLDYTKLSNRAQNYVDRAATRFGLRNTINLTTDKLKRDGWIEWTGTRFHLTEAGRAAFEAAQPSAPAPTRTKTCSVCDGTGKDPLDERGLLTCWKCHGEGIVPAEPPLAPESDTITGYDYMKYVEQAERDGKEPMSFEAWSEEVSDGR